MLLLGSGGAANDAGAAVDQIRFASGNNSKGGAGAVGIGVGIAGAEHDKLCMGCAGVGRLRCFLSD